MSTDGRWAGLRVLVTGGQGFVGAWLAERLVDLGARVIVPYRDLNPYSRLRTDRIAERCGLVCADLTDFDSVQRILSQNEIEAVFHLAAQPIVGIANRSSLSTFESNVRGTYTLLEACRARGAVGAPLERIVVASSDHAYGSKQHVPHREDQPLTPRFPYDVSKACADMIARTYAATYELPVAVTRLANIYGGGDRHWSRIVPDVARALVEGRTPVIRSDGTPERDFLYVEDAVDVYLAVAASLDAPELGGRAWNAGSGVPVSVLELVERLIAAAGKDVSPEVRGTGKPRKEVDRLVLDARAIRGELDWRPKWDLDAGLERTYAWYERLLSGGRAEPVTSS